MRLRRREPGTIPHGMFPIFEAADFVDDDGNDLLLLCTECPRVFRPGDPYGQQVLGVEGDDVMVRVLCVYCVRGPDPEQD